MLNLIIMVNECGWVPSVAMVTKPWACLLPQLLDMDFEFE